jgi:hypothetical protein
MTPQLLLLNTLPINVSASQLSHMQPMTVPDACVLVNLMGLYLSAVSCHQKAYKELLAHVDGCHSRLTRCKTRSFGSLVLNLRELSLSSAPVTPQHAPTAALAAVPSPVATRRTVLLACLASPEDHTLTAPYALFIAASAGEYMEVSRILN